MRKRRLLMVSDAAKLTPLAVPSWKTLMTLAGEVSIAHRVWSSPEGAAGLRRRGAVGRGVEEKDRVY